MLKIGLVGSGFISNFLAKSLLYVRDVEVSAILNRSGAGELSAFFQKHDLGQATVHDTIAELCSDSDVIAIFSPNHTRVAVVKEIVEAVEEGAQLTGVIAEKPLGRTLSEARQQVKLVREAGLLTAYFENQIFMPSIVKPLDQLSPQQKTMGPLLLARSSEEHAGPHSSWFWDPTKQGGGVLCDMGCHSIAVGWFVLTPPGKPVDFLRPVSVTAETSLLKWGRPKYRKQLMEKFSVDYSATPAEDFSTGVITYRNPESGQLTKAQFTVSWMFDKQGLRLKTEALGPGYGLDSDTLRSPGEIFIGDEAADAMADSELALEKSTSSRGLLTVQPNEADLYGYVAEIRDMRDSFARGRDAFLNWEYGVEITRLVQACYMAAERRETIDLTDTGTEEELENFQSLISRGKGAEVLFS